MVRASGWSGTETVEGAVANRSSATVNRGAEKSSALAPTRSVASTHAASDAIPASMPSEPTVTASVAFVYSTRVAETPSVGSAEAP